METILFLQGAREDIPEKVILNVKQEPMGKEYSRQRNSKYTGLKEKNKLVCSRKKQSRVLGSQWMRGRMVRNEAGMVGSAF